MYMLLGDSVSDGAMIIATKSVIPNDPSNRDWQEFFEWIGKGNTPVPKQPSRCHFFNGTEWVLDNVLLDGWLGSLRSARNIELSLTDWTQLPDVQLSQQAVNEWKQYRQDLRDLPSKNLTAYVGKMPDLSLLLEILGRSGRPNA